MSNGHHSKSTTKAADHHLDTWSRRSLRMLRSIANATIDGDSEESGGADDAAWKMESFVGPRIGSVGRASIRVAIQLGLKFMGTFSDNFSGKSFWPFLEVFVYPASLGSVCIF